MKHNAERASLKHGQSQMPIRACLQACPTRGSCKTPRGVHSRQNFLQRALRSFLRIFLLLVLPCCIPWFAPGWRFLGGAMFVYGWWAGLIWVMTSKSEFVRYHRRRT